MPIATGTYTVHMQPQGDPDLQEGGSTLGRMSLDKTFEGDLAATGKGEMLSALTSIRGSAGYVAIERVTGKLHGKWGSFVLQHAGTLHRSAQELSITVVPDSGTEFLTGLRGEFRLSVADGVHRYEFEYTL